jgi:hypothetical protein
MSAKPHYRFAVVATNRGGIALPNLVVKFAYIKPAATLHKRDYEKWFQDTIFDIKPVRKRRVRFNHLIGSPFTHCFLSPPPGDSVNRLTRG